ncbi:MAG: DUF3794 domain-containing protein [Clostridiales bacterium]|nr:DUF3794 domain-containing protein [Clostridiales bacterium]
MSTALHRVESDCFRLIYENESTKEESLELVVPDVCGDVGKILDTRAQVSLNSKKISGDELIISAQAEVSIIYSAEGSCEIHRISALIPFEQSFGLNGGEDCTAIMAQATLSSIDTRALNPRKLLIRAEIKTHVSCYAPDKFVVWDSLENCEEAPVYIQQSQIEHSLITGVCEKSFTLSDEYILPSKYADVRMLAANTDICVFDTNSVGNKLVFKARANTTAIFLNKEDNCLFRYDFTTQFSQIIETDGIGDEHECSVTAQIKELEFTSLPDRENITFAVRMGICAQALCMENISSVYISDAYSNEYELKTEYEEIKALKISEPKTMRISLNGSLPSKASIRDIMYIAPVTLGCTKDRKELSCLVTARGAGIDHNGNIEALEVELKGSCEIPNPENGDVRLLSLCWETLVCEPAAEFSMELVVEYIIEECFQLRSVSGLEIVEEAPQRKEGCPSLIVICAQGHMDIWTLAKKYGSTTELIESANTGEEGFFIEKRPLIIPRE